MTRYRDMTREELLRERKGALFFVCLGIGGAVLFYAIGISAFLLRQVQASYECIIMAVHMLFLGIVGILHGMMLNIEERFRSLETK